MSSTSRAWLVAASVGAVEALKDQGLCGWNYALRSLHQQAKKKYMSSYLQAQRISTSPLMSSLMSSSVASSSSSSLATQRRGGGDEKSKQSEESLRKVMYLSCWGPN